MLNPKLTLTALAFSLAACGGTVGNANTHGSLTALTAIAGQSVHSELIDEAGDIVAELDYSQGLTKIRVQGEAGIVEKSAPIPAEAAALMDAAAYEKVLLTVYKHENPTSPGEGLENASEKALWSGTKGEFCATQNGVDWWACIYWAAFLS
ncbi:MAG: hypothetical protein U1E65_23600 [Myxococcota bacterium]